MDNYKEVFTELRQCKIHEISDGNPHFKYAAIQSLNSNQLLQALRATYNGAVYRGHPRFTLYPQDYHLIAEVADEVTYNAFPEPQEGDLVWLLIE